MGNAVRIGTQVTGVKKASSDLDNLKDKFAKLQSQGAKGFAIGAGAAITAKGLSLVGDAASMAVDALGSMVQGAMADETSLAKLTTALQNNVDGWDGNTAAIEETIAARMKLGFADDVQRESLALLVVKTKDVTEALKIQRVAMDLARLKSISLAEASKAIVMGMMGQGRALKELGINVKEMTDKTEVLGAIQEKAAGQAEKFGETAAGAIESMQVAIDEAGESIGTQLLPMVKELAFFVRDNLVPAMELAGKALDGLRLVTDPSGAAAQFMADKTREEAAALLAARDAALATAKAVREHMLAEEGQTRAMASGAELAKDAKSSIEGYAGGVAKSASASRNAKDALGGVSRSFADLGAASESSGKTVAKSLGEIADAFDATWSELSGAADQAAEDIFGPMERRAALTAAKIARDKALSVVAAPGSSKEDIAAARADLPGLRKDYFKFQAEMAGRGELSIEELRRFNDVLKKELKTATDEEATSINALIALLAKLKGAGVNVWGAAAAAGARIPVGARAEGGPVTANAPVIVGEKGPELFVPGANGAVIPNAGRGGPTWDGGSDASARWLPIIAAQLARLTAQEPYAARPMTARGDLARQAALMPGGRL